MVTAYLSHNTRLSNKRTKVWNQRLHDNSCKKGYFKPEFQYHLSLFVWGKWSIAQWVHAWLATQWNVWVQLNIKRSTDCYQKRMLQNCSTISVWKKYCIINCHSVWSGKRVSYLFLKIGLIATGLMLQRHSRKIASAPTHDPWYCLGAPWIVPKEVWISLIAVPLANENQPCPCNNEVPVKWKCMGVLLRDTIPSNGSKCHSLWTGRGSG